MFHQTIKKCFTYAVDLVASCISAFTVNSDSELSRKRKLPADKLISFLVSQGSSSTKNELLDFFDLNARAPSASAFNQQRAKLSPDAPEAVFGHFNSFVASYEERTSDYRFITADGSSFTFFIKPSFASPEYFVSEGHSAKGFYSMHLNAFYDLEKHTYTDAIIQPVHQKDEFRAFCDMVDSYRDPPGRKTVFIGDRGYCSYNNIAHVIRQGQFFLFRTKDIHKKGLAGNFQFPADDSFDITVHITIVRSHSRKIPVREGFYRRFVDANASFDFVEYGSDDTHELSFRIVRFPLSDSTYECLVTNLLAGEFPPERIKELYFARWGVESSFRKLKYTIGLSNFHAYKPEYIKQEIWARMIAYNITESIINHTVVEHGNTKHTYKVNFSVAAHICRIFLRPSTEKDPIDVISLLKRQLIPIRDEREYPRLKTAHFRKLRYLIYRAA